MKKSLSPYLDEAFFISDLAYDMYEKDGDIGDEWVWEMLASERNFLQYSVFIVDCEWSLFCLVRLAWRESAKENLAAHIGCAISLGREARERPTGTTANVRELSKVLAPRFSILAADFSSRFIEGLPLVCIYRVPVGHGLCERTVEVRPIPAESYLLKRDNLKLD